MSVLFLSIAGLFLCVVPGDSWPGFLGSEATLTTSESIPTKWSPKEGVLWKSAPVGHGQSSPIIWDNKVFVTSTAGPLTDDYYIYCLSLSDGAELWRHALKNSDPVENSLYVSRAAPTPVVDSKNVIAFFESGDIVCLNHAGKQQWSRSIAKDYGKFQNKF